MDFVMIIKYDLGTVSKLKLFSKLPFIYSWASQNFIMWVFDVLSYSNFIWIQNKIVLQIIINLWILECLPYQEFSCTRTQYFSNFKTGRKVDYEFLSGVDHLCPFRYPHCEGVQIFDVAELHVVQGHLESIHFSVPISKLYYVCSLFYWRIEL